jgi:hypothetical protein
VILWEFYTYEVKTILYDVKDGVVVVDVDLSGESLRARQESDQVTITV